MRNVLFTRIEPLGNGSETTSPEKNYNAALRKWRIKAGKAMFALKTIIKEEMLEHVWDDKSPKEA